MRVSVASWVPTGILPAMHRSARSLPGSLAGVIALLTLGAGVTRAAGPPFPEPVDDQAVYDTADILLPATEQELETLIDGVEARTGAEIVVYAQHNPDISEDENLATARALIDQWGIGRSGFDDGLALMVGLDPDPGESRVSLYGGPGFTNTYADEDDLQAIIDEDFVPSARNGDLDGAALNSVEAIDARMRPEAQERLQAMRVANAAIGLIGAPLALLATLGL